MDAPIPYFFSHSTTSGPHIVPSFRTRTCQHVVVGHKCVLVTVIYNLCWYHLRYHEILPSKLPNNWEINMYQLWLTWLVIKDNHWCLMLPSQPSDPSTTCRQEHFKVAMRRTCRVVNLDPAAENFLYDCYADVFWLRESLGKSWGFGGRCWVWKNVQCSILTFCEFGEHKLEVTKSKAGMLIVPSRELTCPTLGKGKSSSKVPLDAIC